ncbi:MAG TPA: protease pro-enzyme activation domain-containing protein [Streptosporangiaceae bacterium]|nr:protease pro-enzyme activation domain-containing protein [Streptosporangiaceae bacterium]
MVRFSTSVLAVAGALAIAVTGMGAVAMASPPPAEVTLAGSVPLFAGHAPTVGSLAASQRLSIEVWLKPDLAGAQRFAATVSTPGSPSFRKYLSPAAYMARFGPPRRETAAAEAWLRSEGFTGVSADTGDDYVRATAPVSTIDAAFHTTLRQYRATATVNAGPYPLFGNARPVTLPASLAPGVLGVTGLDNAIPFLPPQQPDGQSGISGAAKPSVPCSTYYGQHMVSKLPKMFGTTSFPNAVCGYTASQLRAAYEAISTDTGTGQTVALVELGLAPKMFTTLADYAKAVHMPAPSAARYHELDLQPKSCPGDAFNVEEQLDVESVYDMAPGAGELVVGGDGCDNGDSGAQGLYNADTVVINGNGAHPLATIASNSWGSGSESVPADQVSIIHSYLVKAAAVGVGMYFSSGDASGVSLPASDPSAIAVGGTTLGLGKTSNRLFETGWSNGAFLSAHGHWQLAGEDGAAGGGPSQLWQQPSYQQGVVPASLTTPAGGRGGPVRSVPDLSADADPFTGMLIGMFNNKGTFTLTDIGGTSLACPLVAGMVAAAQQGQPTPFGFLDPVFYKLAGTAAFHDALPLTSASPPLWRATVCAITGCHSLFLLQFDDQNPSMLGYTGQVTLKGYDNMTGLGTPNGQAFITALRRMG